MSQNISLQQNKNDAQEMQNRLDLLELERDEKVVGLMHKALNTYMVPVWNGEAQPVERPIGTALTYISAEVRAVKGQVADVNTLLENVRQRKQIAMTFHTALTQIKQYVVKTTWWKTVAFIVAFIAAGVGAMKGIETLIEFSKTVVKYLVH